MLVAYGLLIYSLIYLLVQLTLAIIKVTVRLFAGYKRNFRFYNSLAEFHIDHLPFFLHTVMFLFSLQFIYNRM